MTDLVLMRLVLLFVSLIVFSFAITASDSGDVMFSENIHLSFSGDYTNYSMIGDEDLRELDSGVIITGFRINKSNYSASSVSANVSKEWLNRRGFGPESVSFYRGENLVWHNTWRNNGSFTTDIYDSGEYYLIASGVDLRDSFYFSFSNGCDQMLSPGEDYFSVPACSIESYAQVSNFGKMTVYTGLFTVSSVILVLVGLASAKVYTRVQKKRVERHVEALTRELREGRFSNSEEALAALSEIEGKISEDNYSEAMKQIEEIRATID